MGVFFRKNAHIGPIRLNFSKSGIGASVGVKGLRLTVPARGSAYITAGRHGFYYRQTLQGTSASPVPTPSDTSPANVTDQITNGCILTASPSELIDSSRDDLIQRLNERAKMLSFAPLAIIGAVVLIGLGASISQPILFIPAIACFVLARFLQRRHAEESTTQLFYELGDEETAKFELVRRALLQLNQSQRIWRTTTEVATSDRKRNAGAGKLITRSVAGAGKLDIPRVRTNVDVMGLDIGSAKVYFLPDIVLYLEDRTFGAIDYDDITVQTGTTRFIEEESVPSDATVVGTTWRYVNKSGGPDRRFKDNRQIPIAQYGTIELRSSKGLNIHLDTSSVEKAATFSTCLAARIQRVAAYKRASRATTTSDNAREHALRILGLDDQAKIDDIRAAYHRLTQMYHPDRVAGLAPEFQNLAHQRQTEINAAYAVLKADQTNL